MNQQAIQQCCCRILERIRAVHLRNIANSDGPVFYISDTYPGVWMEHVYDSIVWADLSGENEVAKN